MEENENGFAALEAQVKAWRQHGQRIVLCHGCFDPLHVGHLLHFRAAKNFGDRLVVTVTPDRYVNKGPDRPLFSEELRLEMILALRIVDAAALNLWDSAVETIRRLHPHSFAKGSEYRDHPDRNINFLLERQEIQSSGGSVIYTEEPSFSATEIIRCMTNRSTWIRAE